MEPEVDAPIIVASLMILGILVSSVALWIRHIQRPRGTIAAEPGAAAWPIAS
jgi:hypothetical protein